MKPKKINLKPFIKQVARQKKLDAAWEKANAKLPKEAREAFAYQLMLMSKLASQYKGKTLDIEVVKLWLYSQGLTDNEARMLLWNATGRGIIQFDYNFNIKCL